MKTTTASFALFVVIALCGYVVANGTGMIKIAGFIMGIMAAMLSIYLYWKNRDTNTVHPKPDKD